MSSLPRTDSSFCSPRRGRRFASSTPSRARSTTRRDRAHLLLVEGHRRPRTRPRADPNARDALARSRSTSAGHHTTLQHAHFQFALENVSRQFLWTFLHSHPFYNSEQVSQRYVEVKPGHLRGPADATGRARDLRDGGAAAAGGLRSASSSAPDPARRASATSASSRAARAATAGRSSPSAVKKRAQEIARYVLPVATFAYLYHTVSGITLFRYWRLCESFDAPHGDSGEVVGQMVEAVLAPRPAVPRRPRGAAPARGDAGVRALRGAATSRGPAARRVRAARFATSSTASSTAGCRASSTGKPNNEERRRARRCARCSGVPRALLSDDDAIVLALDPAKNPAPRRDHDADDAREAVARAVPRQLHLPQEAFARRGLQDQRHRMTPGLAPGRCPRYLTDEPDYVVPMLVARRARGGGALPRLDGANRGTRSGGCASSGVPDEYAAYLLPNAVAVRFTESADLLTCITSSRAPLLQRAGGDLARVPRRGAPDPRRRSAHRPRGSCRPAGCATTRASGPSAPRATASAASRSGSSPPKTTGVCCKRRRRPLARSPLASS